MTNERCAFTLTLLPNGKVLAAGGFGTNGAVATAELYDPADWSLDTDRFTPNAARLAHGDVVAERQGARRRRR